MIDWPAICSHEADPFRLALTPCLAAHSSESSLAPAQKSLLSARPVLADHKLAAPPPFCSITPHMRSALTLSNEPNTVAASSCGAGQRGWKRGTGCGCGWTTISSSTSGPLSTRAGPANADVTGTEQECRRERDENARPCWQCDRVFPCRDEAELRISSVTLHGSERLGVQEFRVD